MAIHGTIEEAGGLADVLQLLALGRKTGCLNVVDGDASGRVFLELGQVAFASLSNKRDRLGEMLVKSGRISKVQLEQATEVQRNSKRQLGRILVDSGSIPRAEVEKYIRSQVEEAVYQLFTWTRGTFTFTSEQIPSHQALLVSLDAESLLLEGARRIDEWDMVQKKIPSFDMIFRVNRQKLTHAAATELTEDQKAIIPLLDGTRDVHAVIETAELVEFDVGKALYGLIVAGFAQIVERRARIRHLEYRELLAYVVREAEFTDPARRKEAGRHIVDCPSCAERLRSIHVRRTTEGHAVVLPPELEPTAETVETPALVAVPVGDVDEMGRPSGMHVAPVEVAAPAPPAVAPAPRPTIDRRAGDRRTGMDRRYEDRRAGRDRRRGFGDTAWLRDNEDRRHASRRQGERRTGLGRSTDRRPGVAAAAASPAPAAAMAAAVMVAAVARATEERRVPNVQPAFQFEEDAIIAEAPPAAPQAAAPPPAAAPDRRSTKEIEWVVTPEQSVEMMRVSRSQLPVPQVKPPAPPAKAAPPPAPRQRQPSMDRLTTSREHRAVRMTPPAPPAPSAEAEEQQYPFVDRRRTPLPQRHPQSVGRMVPPPSIGSGQIVISVRQLAIAASFAGVALIGYALGKGRGGDANVATRQPVQEVASAPSQPEQRDTGRGSRSSIGVAARVVEAPPQREPAPERAALSAQEPPRRPVERPPVSAPREVATRRDEPPAQQPQVAADPAPAPAPAPPPSPAPAPVAVVPPPAPAPAPSGPAPTAAEPDREVASGGWAPADRAEAATILGGTFGAIQGLSIESISKSTSGARPRVRVTQLTESGQRIILTLTRAGAAVSAAGTARVTALRVIPPSDAYPMATGSVSFGNILITARAGIPADELRGHLERLAER